MSRGAATPQKDGKPPCKVVVLGTEGQDPGAVRAVERRLAGTISRFYNASRQNSDASLGDVWHAHLELPAKQGRLSYSSNQGMETMTIRLNPVFVEEFSEEKVPKKERVTWDWLLVDLELEMIRFDATPPRVQKMQTVARFWDPPLPDILDDSEPPEVVVESAVRIAWDDQRTDSWSQQEPRVSPGIENPRLMFAGAERADQIGDVFEPGEPDGIFRSSLLVDIRNLTGRDDIMIDLWCSLLTFEVEKALQAVITRAFSNSSLVPRVIGQYSGGSGGRTYVETMFPDVAATVTTWTSRSTGFLNNNFIPDGFSANTMGDAAYTAANFTPTSLGWIDVNNNVLDEPLWEQNFTTTWSNTDIPGDPQWEDGYWVSGADMTYYLDAMDGLAVFGDVTAPAPAEHLGKMSIDVVGDPWWWTDNGTLGADYYGLGDPGTPPPNSYGDTDTTAQGFQFATVRNTYIFRGSLHQFDYDDEPVNDTVAIKASAFKNLYLDPPEDGPDTARWVWTIRRPSEVNEMFDQLGIATNWEYNQWDVKVKFPDRDNIGTVATAVAVPVDNSVDLDHFAVNNAKYIGRLHFHQGEGGPGFRFILPEDIDIDEIPEVPE